MGCLGVHFALTEEEVAKLRSCKDDAARLEYLQNDIEERYFKKEPEWKAETDKAWDAIHRALTDGKLAYDNGKYPLNHVILGGEPIYAEGDYIMALKTPDQVRAIAGVLSEVGEDALRRGYFAMDTKEYGFPLTEEDFKYTWEWFSGLKPFWKNAASAGRYILFTADQ